ncbi:MAG: enoyl-CoA hydratase [Acidimicrobiales bacterium]
MSYVNVEQHDRVAVITLDDPKRRNALNLDLCTELVAVVESAEADPGTGALVITGAPPAFCAGADLSQLGESQRDGLKAIYSGFLRVASSTLPTVAAVNGAAVGAGMNLALACDVRLAARSARFDTRFLDLGLHPGGGHTWMMRRIIGPQATAAMVLFGQAIDGAEAERIGLAWKCVDDDVLLGEAIAMAARAASGPPDLVPKIKATIGAMAGIETHDEAVERELDPQVWSINEPAFAERLAALQQRIKS